MHNNNSKKTMNYNYNYNYNMCQIKTMVRSQYFKYHLFVQLPQTIMINSDIKMTMQI